MHAHEDVSGPGPVSYADDQRTVRTPAYHVRLDPIRPQVELTAPDGTSWGRLNLIASAHPLDGRDTARPDGGPEPVSQSADRVVIGQPLNSTVWSDAEVRLDCRPDHLTVTFTISTDRPRLLDRVTVLGGEGWLRSGAAGAFRSGIGFDTLFVPNPTEPVAPFRPAAVPATIALVGDADPGRLHGVFSPAPFAYAFGRQQSWLGLGLRAGIAECTFSQLSYQPIDGGYWLEFDHQGRTEVRDRWSVTLTLRPTGSPWAALAEHRQDLLDHGLLPEPAPVQRAGWWTEPLFCGWGAQCAEAGRRPEPTAPAALCRQDLYDQWLRQLDDHGIVPGTVVLDDRWQQAYGTAEPDPDQWPDLRSWIADRHAAGQRVLLWWKAWDPQGLPAGECVTDPAGRPVAADPGSPAYRRRLTKIIERLLGDDGLAADGFKIDFTQRAPSAAALQGHGPWGAAGLHALLKIIYDTAKRVRPDSLIITHAVNPLFADVADMIRLNDITERDLAGDRVPVTDQMQFRHRVVRSVLPDHLIDTDQWPMPDREQWLHYSAMQPELGVPALYYVDRIDNSGEEITGDQLQIVAKAWQLYRELQRDRSSDGRR